MQISETKRFWPTVLDHARHDALIGNWKGIDRLRVEDVDREAWWPVRSVRGDECILVDRRLPFSTFTGSGFTFIKFPRKSFGLGRGCRHRTNRRSLQRKTLRSRW